MAFTNMKAKSWATVVDTTEVDWEIEGWNGPLGDLMRTRSCCLVKEGDVHLRFHLRSFNCMDDKLHTFCLQKNNYVPLANACDLCTNCLATPIPFPETPYEHLLPTGVKCSGYKLLVDVLSLGKQLNFSVSVKMPGRSTYACRTHFVTLEPEGKRTSVVAIENFYRTGRWTLDKDGTVRNYRPTSVSQADGKFQLTVTVYQMEFAETDGKYPEENPQAVLPKANPQLQKSCNAQLDVVIEQKVKKQPKSSAVTPVTKDDKSVPVGKSVPQSDVEKSFVEHRAEVFKTSIPKQKPQSPESCNAQLEAGIEKGKKVKEKAKPSNITLLTKDHKSVSVSKSVLKTRNSYFRKHFERTLFEKPKPISVDVNEQPLRCILHWMETGSHLPESGLWMREIRKASKKLELKGFLANLDNCLGSFCTQRNMYELRDLTLEYNLAKGKAEVDQFIKQVKIAELEERHETKKVALLCTY